MKSTFYTTGEIAKITGISHRTIKYYCSQGKIVSETTPLTNYRRITYPNLINFFRENAIPLDLLERYAQKRILIVDDDKQIVRLVEALITQIHSNVHIETAYDGYEACIKAGGLLPDIIFLDLQMPKADGFEVCRNIRNVQATSHAEIVVITGNPTDDAIARLKEYNVRQVFPKPIDLEKLTSFCETLFKLN